MVYVRGGGEFHVGQGRFMLENEGVNRSDANCCWLTERESQRTRFCNSQSRLSFVYNRLFCWQANSNKLFPSKHSDSAFLVE